MTIIGIQDSLKSLGKIKIVKKYIAIVNRDSDDEDDTADQEELSKLKNYKEAVVALEEVSRFLEFRRHGEEVLSIGNMIDRVVNLKHASARQTIIIIS